MMERRKIKRSTNKLEIGPSCPKTLHISAREEKGCAGMITLATNGVLPEDPVVRKRDAPLSGISFGCTCMLHCGITLSLAHVTH